MTAMLDYNKLLEHSGILGCDAVSLGVCVVPGISNGSITFNFMIKRSKQHSFFEPSKLKHEGSTFLGNVRKTYTNDTVSHP
jgi:hypothetical protein